MYHTNIYQQWTILQNISVLNLCSKKNKLWNNRALQPKCTIHFKSKHKNAHTSNLSAISEEGEGLGSRKIWWKSWVFHLCALSFDERFGEPMVKCWAPRVFIFFSLYAASISPCFAPHCLRAFSPAYMVLQMCWLPFSKRIEQRT